MIRKLIFASAISALALLAAGCDDDDAPSAPATVTLGGTAAMGAPIVGGTVTARGANGTNAASTLTGSNGSYTIEVTGLTAPIIVRVQGGTVDDDNDPLTAAVAAETQVSMATAAISGTLNLTTLTTLAVQQAAAVSDLAALYSGWATTRPTATELAAAAAAVRANLATAPEAAAITGWATYNFLTTAFTANHSGVDALMDAVSCGASGSAGTLSVSCTGGITYNLTISTTGFTIGGGGGGGGGGGTLTIPPTSTWSKVVNGMAATSVPGSEVPATQTAANTFGNALALASTTFSGGGYTFSVSGLSVTFSNTGDGSAVGDTVTTHVVATVTVSPVPFVGTAVVPVDTTAVWTRTN